MNCPRCGVELPGHSPSSECPSCGKTLSEPRSYRDSPQNAIKTYFSDLWEILTNPTQFFKRMNLRGGLTGPLSFALITHWIGSAIGYLWHLLIGVQFLKIIQTLTQIMGEVAERDYPGQGTRILEARDRILNWFFGAGPIIIDPFLNLFSIFITSIFIYLGARILITPGIGNRPKEITYETVLRILCFGMSPAILAALPLFGGFISSLCVLIVTVIGFKVIFKIGTWRALAVYLFPKILFFAIMGIGLISLAVILIKLFISSF